MDHNLSIIEVKQQIAELKIKFRDEITDISNKCEVPILVTIDRRDHNNNFYRNKSGFPFDINVSPIIDRPKINPVIVLGTKPELSLSS